MENSAIKKQPKRIAIYVIYDQDGILDGFRRYYLQELRKVVDNIVVVVSGTLTPESREELKELADDFYVRENKGLLAGSWVDGIAHIGWDRLEEYDELLMLNDSFFGPFYPLGELMDAAEKSDADFYGAIKNFENKDITQINGKAFKHGHLRGSICYFYIIKSKLLHSAEFRNYWGKMPEIQNSYDTFFFSELDFYDYVVDAGFKVDAYQSDKLKGYCHDSLSLCMEKLIEQDRVPFARIRPFSFDMKPQSMQIGYGEDVRKTLEYIDKNTDYDVNLIWDYLLRTKNLRTLWEQLQLEYVINRNVLERPFTYDKEIAVILHIYYEDQVEKMATYCENFPEKTKFFITAVRDDTEESIHREFKKRNLNYELKRRPNVGVAMSSLWVTFADVVTSGKYEYIFYFHDKKSPYGSYGAAHGEQFGHRCYEALAGSKEIICNIINLMEDNPRMGIVGPPEMYHGDYLFSPYICWPGNFQNTVDLAKRLDLKVDIRATIPPVAPYGDMLWFRADAMKKAIGVGMTYDDFDIPYKPDNTFMHAIERIYGYAAQDSGYYYADVIDIDAARSDLVNYQYMINQFLAIPLNRGYCANNFEMAKYIFNMSSDLMVGGGNEYFARKLIKNKIRRMIPGPIWSLLKKIYCFFGGKKWIG